MENIFIACDDMNFRRSLAIGFEAMRYTAVEAEAGMEALK